MITILAEKPSVAQEIAVHLHITQRKNGYWQGNGYAVTWALGHLVGLAMPEAYGYKGFQREHLPMLPDNFKLVPRQKKATKGYKDDERAVQQLAIIEDLFNQSEKIIVATDAGREGELIFRYIYNYLNCKVPFDRLWISSLTEMAIAQGFENLKKGSEFDNLYQSAKARSEADWYIGINATQALSAQANNGVYSLGRVQTPTLAMVCKRFLEHKNFKSVPFWKIELEHKFDGVSFKTISNENYSDKTTAQSAIDVVQTSNSARVTKVETNQKREQPPLLYDLTGLQKEANTKLNLSAEKTLQVAQSLYEKKLITYPRTGSCYISEDMWAEIPKLIQVLEENEQLREYAKELRVQKLQKRIINDAKVTDHHALLITENTPENINSEEQAIYQLIASRLLESVSEPCIKETTKIECMVADQIFSTTDTMIVVEGWRNIRGNFEDKDNQELPEIKENDVLKIQKTNLLERQTKPQPLLTEASLLSAMERAGKEVENELERLAMKEVGIGTPATRSGIIETLFSRNYIERQKKSLVPTEKGLLVYDIVKDKRIADVSMTGMWEKALAEIEQGEMNAQTFQNGIKIYAEQITNELLQTEIKNLSETAICPKCKKEHLRIYDKVVKCPSEDCQWLLFRTICDKKLSLSAVNALLEKGKTPLLKGLKGKNKKPFDAYLVLNKDGTTTFDFPKNRGKRK
ncbi:MAG: DNA topoisomerase 3 [Flavobacteriaceae bacterium]|nr:DNA topoisomerase 3 [Flavobacteriaceae bacterium]